VGRRASGEVFLLVTVILCGWMLWDLGRARLRQLLPLLLLAGVLAVCGRFGIERAEQWLGWRHELSTRGFDPNFASTRIGQAGPVQLSAEILWRLSLPERNPAPRLLRTGLFNTYLGRNWQNHRVASVDFRDLDTRTIDDAAHYMIGTLPDHRGSGSLTRYRLRGAANAETPLPLPGGATALRDFRLDGVETNSFGTVRLYPSDPVIVGWVLWEAQSHHESAPIWDEDLRIPLVEREVVRKVRQDIGILDDDELAVSLGKLRRYLNREFRYTQDLKISKSPYQASGLSAIGQFLTKERAGHCEYFATAAALILRDAGIPARYATGYALLERGARRGEFVVRRLHGHAWCRVWDDNSEAWMDFDPTPPAALAPLALNEIGTMQRIYDQLLCWREDFFLWRNEPSNRRGIMLALAGLIVSVCAWIGWRMWGTRRRLPTTEDDESYPTLRTPLRDLDPMLERLLGPRAVGQSYANWLMGLNKKIPDTQLLERAIFLHQRLRFDPGPVDEDISSELQKITEHLHAALAGISVSHENSSARRGGSRA
ncbi:MAG: transglutaminase-like domain-containing protein, partial [Luteolibacter sp.]